MGRALHTHRADFVDDHRTTCQLVLPRPLFDDVEDGMVEEVDGQLDGDVRPRWESGEHRRQLGQHQEGARAFDQDAPLPGIVVAQLFCGDSCADDTPHQEGDGQRQPDQDALEQIQEHDADHR